MTRALLLLAGSFLLALPAASYAQVRDEVGQLRLEQQYVAALDRVIRELEERHRDADFDTTAVLRSLNRVSQLAIECGDHFAARFSAEAATSLATAWDRPTSAERGAAWLWLGLLDRREFGPGVARERLVRARTELEKTPEAHRTWGHLLQGEANVRRSAAGSPQAVPLYRAAAEHRRAHLPRPDLDLADNLVWLAWNLNEAGELDEAEAVAREAAAELAALGAEEHSLQKSLLEMDFDRAVFRGDFEACRRFAEAEVEVHERNRLRFPFGYARGTGCSPLSYARLLWVRLQAGEYDRAFQTWDEVRGTVGREYAALRSWLSGEGRDRRPQLEARFLRLQAAVLDFDAADSPAARVRGAVESLVAWWAVVTWIERWESEFPRVEIDVERVRSLLEPGQALVGFQTLNVGGKESQKLTVRRRDRWGVIVRPDRDLVWVRTAPGSDDDLREIMRVDQLLMEARERAIRWPTRVGFDPELHQKLVEQTNRLFGAVLPHLDGIHTVLSVGTDTDHRYSYCEDRSRNVVTVPSARTFVQLAEARAEREDRSRCLVMGATRADSDTPLAYVESELSTLRQLLPEARILSEDDASERRWEELHQRGRLEGLARLHLACHVRQGPTAQRDALLLDDATGPGRGALEAGELLLHYAVDPDLVVLSGCSTGQGRHRISGEHYSLTQALLASGALSVVASRWDVDDEASALFMRRFYENLTGKFEGSRDGHASMAMPVAAAVGEASRWLREYRDASGNRPFADPIYWGAFGAYGLP